MMKFESKFDLDEVLATNFGGDLVKVKAVIFSDENIFYSVRRSDGILILMQESELNNDEDHKDDDASA